MAPLAHSSSSANHPVKQGLWGISEVFVDTIIVCTMTALVVLCTGVWTEGGTGAALTATAFGAGFGNAIAGTVFVVAIITFFAFTTALVNVYYGEICMTVLAARSSFCPTGSWLRLRHHRLCGRPQCAVESLRLLLRCVRRV